jgi:hypothetical protein
MFVLCHILQEFASYLHMKIVPRNSYPISVQFINLSKHTEACILITSLTEYTKITFLGSTVKVTFKSNQRDTEINFTV